MVNQSHAVGADWRFGAGPLGWDSTVKEIPLGTNLTRPSLNPAAPVITYYFETDFNLSKNEMDQINALN